MKKLTLNKKIIPNLNNEVLNKVINNLRDIEQDKETNMIFYTVIINRKLQEKNIVRLRR